MEKEIRVIERLATSLNRRDEVPNQELAKEIVARQDQKAVQVLVENLSGKKAIQNDCIKVLYEIGAVAPNLITGYIDELVVQLGSKNNRLQWGVLTALSTVTTERPKAIYAALPTILEAANKGSVISKDQAVNILINLCSVEQYAERTFNLLMEQLLKSAPNQLPLYAERAVSIVTPQNRQQFVQTLTTRLEDMDSESKRKRVEKVIKKCSSQ